MAAWKARKTVHGRAAEKWQLYVFEHGMPSAGGGCFLSCGRGRVEKVSGWLAVRVLLSVQRAENGTNRTRDCLNQGQRQSDELVVARSNFVQHQIFEHAHSMMT